MVPIQGSLQGGNRQICMTMTQDLVYLFWEQLIKDINKMRREGPTSGHRGTRLSLGEKAPTGREENRGVPSTDGCLSPCMRSCTSASPGLFVGMVHRAGQGCPGLGAAVHRRALGVPFSTTWTTSQMTFQPPWTSME